MRTAGAGTKAGKIRQQLGEVAWPLSGLEPNHVDGDIGGRLGQEVEDLAGLGGYSASPTTTTFSSSS